MDLPRDNYWNEQTGFHPWYTSHGSPSVGPNSIWMWSANNRGEGMNLAYNFLSQKNYCIETTFTFTTGNDNNIPPNARSNIYLTGTQVFGASSMGAPFPPLPAANQLVW